MSVQVTIDNIRYQYWKSASITRRLDALSGRFALTLSDPPDGTARAFRAGAKVVISMTRNAPEGGADGVGFGRPSANILTGHIDSVSNSLDGSDHSVSVSGRSLVADAVDSMNATAPLKFPNATLAQIARALLRPFGIGFTADAAIASLPLEGFNRFAGDTVGASLLKLSRQLGVWIISDANGTIRAFKARPSATAKASLVEGQTLLSISLSEDHSNRFHRYIVRSEGGFSGNAKNEAVIKDHEITRNRILLFDDSDGILSAPDYARFEANARKAASTQIEVIVQSLHPEWELGDILHITSPTLGIDGNFAIRQSELLLDDDGSRTLLKLTLPDALLRLKEPPKEQGLF